MKQLKTKIILLGLGFITLLYFSSDFSLIDIQKTAIIAAIAIDTAEEGYEITAQIAVPQATDQAAANNDAVISGKGRTVMEAIDNIGIKTGWHPKLSFCNLILVGREIIENNMMNIVDYLIASSKVQNSAIIAAADEKARDLLYAKTPLDSISAFALQKILLRDPLKVNTVSVINLRQFAMDYYSQSNSGFMPIIKIEKTENKGKEGGSSAEMASSGGGSESSSGSSGSSGENADVIFDATTTAVFSNGKLAVELSAEETLMHNLLTKSVEESFIAIEDGEETILLSIQENENDINVQFKVKPELKLKLSLGVKIEDGTTASLLSKYPHTGYVEPKTLENCKVKVEGIINGLTEKLKSSEADLFKIKTMIYKYHHPRYADYKKLSLSSFNILQDITIKSLD